MHWNDDARAALTKAPFFLRGMITRRAEEHARKQGREVVTLADLEELRAGIMSNEQIEKTVRSNQPQVIVNERTYEVKVCSSSGCPRSLFDVLSLAGKITELIEQSRVPEAVLHRARGPILRHHKLLVSISGCPNSCSQPQIADFGVQGRAKPVLGKGACSGCGGCVDICSEHAVTIPGNIPTFDANLCINCGDCAGGCPMQAIIMGERGFSALIGGKLGRHPRLAQALFDFCDQNTLLNAFQVTCEIFADDLQPGERLADTIARIGIRDIRRSITSGHFERT